MYERPPRFVSPRKHEMYTSNQKYLPGQRRSFPPHPQPFTGPHLALWRDPDVVNVDVPTWPHSRTLSPTPGATRFRRTCLCVLPVGRRSHGVVLWVGDTEQTASDLHVQLAVLRGPLVSTSESNRETATQGALSTDIPASFGLCCAYLYSCPSLWI